MYHKQNWMQNACAKHDPLLHQDLPKNCCLLLSRSFIRPFLHPSASCISHQQLQRVFNDQWRKWTCSKHPHICLFSIKDLCTIGKISPLLLALSHLGINTPSPSLDILLYSTSIRGTKEMIHPAFPTGTYSKRAKRD